ncbi:MAG: hypothetical protein Q7Q71_07460 [Verrucomicrobiota bacterium JB023]|nr:hypothetical protein [Verrucomicrobiota bacterium JB023]
MMAWWSTRVGLGLGVIAAVFFGLYVNQDTVPWVRLLELVLAAIVVFFLGIRLESKLPAFGRAVGTGGLSLLYVAAYAAYGLPALKVIESPGWALAWQGMAVAAICGWSLFRGSQAVATFGLFLGYLSVAFSIAEGLAPMSLAALGLLTLGGTTLAWKKDWWASFVVGVLGSGSGLVLLSFFRWSGDAGQGMGGLFAAVGMTALWLLALFLKGHSGGDVAQRLAPLASGVGLLSGYLVASLTGVSLSIYYSHFLVVIGLAAIFWKEDSEWARGVRQTFALKAVTLLGLLLIDQLGGAVRAFGLLGQGGALLYLARKKAWPLFEVIAGVVSAVGWYWVAKEVEGDGGHLFAYGYLTCLAALVAWHSGWRRVPGLSEFFLGLCAIGWSWVALAEDLSAPLGALLGGLFILGGSVLMMARRLTWIVPPIFLLVGFFWLFFQSDSHSREGLVWLVVAWACYGAGSRFFFGQLVVRAVCFGILLLSLVLIGRLGYWLDLEQWLPAAFLLLALLWLALDQIQGLRDLGKASGCALVGSVGSLLAWPGGSSEEARILATVLFLGACGYWTLDTWKGREGRRCGSGWGAVRTGCTTVLTLASLASVFSGSALLVTLSLWSLALQAVWYWQKESSLTWALAATCVTMLATLSFAPSAFGAGLTAVCFVIHGALLARNESNKGLANPRLATTLWGGTALVVLLAGIGSDARVAPWVTILWVVGCSGLLVAGFWLRLRGYRVFGLLGLAIALLRMFVVDIDEPFWRIVAFGLTGGLLVAIGFIYQRFHRKLADGDLDWGQSSPRGLGDLANESAPPTSSH